jgi:hypothetical protein
MLPCLPHHLSKEVRVVVVMVVVVVFVGFATVVDISLKYL